MSEVCFNATEEEVQKLRNMYVGTVRTLGSTYSVHEWFSMQGVFSIKVTPMGANKVLMEEMEEGVFQELMANYKEWLYAEFDDIRRWEPDIVDNERVVWVRCHGIPIHAWKEEFFASLARNFGEYLGVDESTRSKSELDIARIKLRTNGYDIFNAVVTANINGSLFHVKVIEEWCGPLHWIDNQPRNTENDSECESEESHGEDHPLFTVEDGWCSSNEEGEEDGVREDGFENEEERDNKFEDETIVQETVDGSNVFRRSNDCLQVGIVSELNAVVENQRNSKDGAL